jgi:hypothetical protein
MHVPQCFHGSGQSLSDIATDCNQNTVEHQKINVLERCSLKIDYLREFGFRIFSYLLLYLIASYNRMGKVVSKVASAVWSGIKYVTKTVVQGASAVWTGIKYAAGKILQGVQYIVKKAYQLGSRLIMFDQM